MVASLMIPFGASRSTIWFVGSSEISPVASPAHTTRWGGARLDITPDYPKLPAGTPISTRLLQQQATLGALGVFVYLGGAQCQIARHV